MNVLRVICQGDQQAIHPFVIHGMRIGLFFFDFFERLSDDQVIVFATGRIFHAGKHRRHKITVETRDDNTNCMCSFTPKLPEDRVNFKLMFGLSLTVTSWSV